jgi:hypothetical protein
MMHGPVTAPRGKLMEPTEVYDTYWRFAAERQSIYLRRLAREPGPWTKDPIIRAYRFTNTYRASDRVSQYLIREVLYREDRPQAAPEVFFRTMLFKLFNKIETWEAIESKVGPVAYKAVNFNTVSSVLDDLLNQGHAIYSAAYIMPSPRLGRTRKHDNHLALLSRMMEDHLPDRIRQAASLATVYEMLLRYPGIGSFLAFQYAIDLNYSTLLDFDESDFVMAGPGALDGIAKCFTYTGNCSPEDVIYRVADDQVRSFARMGINFPALYGRPLQPIDCQNLFCEISKYARVAHPQHRGIAGRTRIKQSYTMHPRPLPSPMFPPRWKLDHSSPSSDVVPSMPPIIIDHVGSEALAS